MQTDTRTNVRLPLATTNTTTHAPMTLEMTVTIETGRDGTWAGLVIETRTPRPVAIVVKD